MTYDVKYTGQPAILPPSLTRNHGTRDVYPDDYVRCR